MSDLAVLRRLETLEYAFEQLRKVDRPGAPASWTPFFEGSSTAGTYAYTTQSGSYLKVGKRAYIDGHLLISAISVAPVGNMLITGLPIVSSASGEYSAIAFGFVSNLNMPASKTVVYAAVPPGGLNRINLYTFQAGAGGAAYPAASFTNAACELIFSGWYQID